MESISFRPIGMEDEELLYRIYASTREEELAPVPWSDAEKEAFLRMQFRLQHAYYIEHFGSAQFAILERNGEPAGRLYLLRAEDEYRIIDIALLPEHRNLGIGGALLRQIQAEAGAAGKPLRIHVEKFNPALRLYHRLGFREIGDEEVYYHMEWRGSAGA